jgi:hypothetical protein
MNDRRFCVDGHEFPNKDSDFAGDGEYPPFVIFDIENQRNLPGEYATREEAETELNKVNYAHRP